MLSLDILRTNKATFLHTAYRNYSDLFGTPIEPVVVLLLDKLESNLHLMQIAFLLRCRFRRNFLFLHNNENLTPLRRLTRGIIGKLLSLFVTTNIEFCASVAKKQIEIAVGNFFSSFPFKNVHVFESFAVAIDFYFLFAMVFWINELRIFSKSKRLYFVYVLN